MILMHEIEDKWLGLKNQSYPKSFLSLMQINDYKYTITNYRKFPYEGFYILHIPIVLGVTWQLTSWQLDLSIDIINQGWLIRYYWVNIIIN